MRVRGVRDFGRGGEERDSSACRSSGRDRSRVHRAATDHRKDGADLSVEHARDTHLLESGVTAPAAAAAGGRSAALVAVVVGVS